MGRAPRAQWRVSELWLRAVAANPNVDIEVVLEALAKAVSGAPHRAQILGKGLC